MANPGDLSSKKIKNTYKRIVQYDGLDHEIYDGTGSRIVDLNVTRITASNASLANIQDLQHLTVSRVQVDTHLSVSGSTFLGDGCEDDQLKVHGNTWVTGALTVSGSCQGSFRSIGQAKFIYLQNPGIEDQKPAKVNRGKDGTGGFFNVPRFGGENAALDVYGNVVITGSLIVEDTIFAQEFHTEIVSQSIIFTSGSTKFGADFDDTMLVTGSIMQSGSDSYFLNGIGIGTSGSQLPGTFTQPGQANPPLYTHLLRIDDKGHNGLGFKNGKVIYATYTTPAEDNFRFRDKTQSDDVFVINGNTLSVFFTTNDKYNVGIAVPSGSTIDENLVVSSSTNSRVKIESATAITSASLYLESGQGVWEIATTSASSGANNQFSESLVFRTYNSEQENSGDTTTWSGNGTYTEALRLDKRGTAGFGIPSINAYRYPQQVQVSGSINVIQGRTIDINAGTFHDSDGINGIYFNNQKMIYVSGSGANTSIFFGNSAGGTNAATGGEANIGFGYRAGQDLTTGDYNTIIGWQSGQDLTTGGSNVFLGKTAGMKTISGDANIAIGHTAFYNSTNAVYNVAIGYEAMKTGVTTGADNIAIGRKALEDTTTGHHNISIGHKAASGLTTADNNIAIGEDALGLGTLTGDLNIAIGKDSGLDITSGTSNVLMGVTAGASLTAGSYNVALGFGALDAATAASNQVAIGSNAMGTGVVTGGTNVAIGANALADTTSGFSNVALGTGAAEELTSGYENVAIGQSALGKGIVTGHYNIALGVQALDDTTSGNDNIALGKLAAGNLTTGISNIAVGSGSMGLGTVISHDNIAIGNFALEDNTSGGNNIAIGSGSLASATNNIGNIALGFEALKTSANDGARNIAIGYQAMKTGDVSGDNNIAVGTDAATNITSGANNTIIGVRAGVTVTTNTKNILIGSGSDAAAAIDNAYAIGTDAIVTQANSMVLGGQTGERFSIGMGGITAPNSTLEVSGSVRVTGSLIVSSSNTTTIKGPMFVGQENATDAWTMAHYGDTDTKWVIDDDDMIYTVGNVQMFRMREDGTSSAITVGSGADDVDFVVTSEGITDSLVVQGSTGKVGLGTTTPGEKLEVIGNISASGTIFADTYKVDDQPALSNSGTDLNLGNSNYWERLIYGRQGSDQHIFIGNITASSNISASGDIFTEAIYMSQGNSTTKTLNINPNSNGVKFGVDSHTLQVYGNIRAGLSTATQHEFNGNISASGNITASGTLFANNAQFGSSTVYIDGPAGHITASGNISASGTITGDNIVASSQVVTPAIANTNNDQIILVNVPAGIGVVGPIDADGHITASGNISSSGYIYGAKYYSNGGGIAYDNGTTTFYGNTKLTEIDGTNITLDAPVTASGNISASGGMTARHQILQTTTIAAIGNAAANGADLPSIGHQIITGADGTKAATLPQAVTLTVGHTITIQNKAGSALKVFPHSGDTIIPLTQDSAASVPANTAMVVTVAGEDSYAGYFTTVIS